MADRVPSFGDKIMVRTGNDEWTAGRVIDGGYVRLVEPDGRACRVGLLPEWRFPEVGEWPDE